VRDKTLGVNKYWT